MAITLGDVSTAIALSYTASLSNYSLMDGRSRILFFVTNIICNQPIVQSTPTFNGDAMNLFLAHGDPGGGYELKVHYLLEEDLPVAGDYNFHISNPTPSTRMFGVMAAFCVNGAVQQVPTNYGTPDTVHNQTRSPVTLTGVSNGSLFFFDSFIAGRRSSATPDANYTEQWDEYNPYNDGVLYYMTNTGLTRAITSDGDYTGGATFDNAGSVTSLAFEILAIKNNFSAMINVI
jgi:hypothetical protein